MRPRIALVLIAAIAALNGAFFIYYQSPDWTVEWTDQEGYRTLGRIFAETGEFTRYPDSPTFVPEVIRTPGYPVFVGVIYKLFGRSQTAVAVAQTVLFVGIALLTFVIARAVAPRNIALAAAAATAVYPTLPYYGALILTEVWTAFVLTLAFAAAFRAARTGARRDHALAGFLFGCATLIRPAFVLLPFALVGMGTLIFRRSFRRVMRPWAWMLGVFMLTLLPWFTFNYVVMGRFALAPAGGVGRGLWEGSWQGRWPGRIHNELTLLATDISDRPELDARVNELAAQTGSDPEPMRTYVHQWQDIRQIWFPPAPPMERSLARIRADQEYGRVALENIKADLMGHIRRRLTRGLAVLWITDVPIRYSDINTTPPIAIRAIWAVQAVLLLLASWGAWRLIEERRLLDAWLLVTPLLYVTVVHLPLLTEARQSLPLKPLLLILATIGAADVWHRLFALKAQVHERQHV